MQIVLAGATGLIGGTVLDQLLAHPDGPSVLVLTRRPTGRSSPRLTERVAEMTDWPGIVAMGHADTVICTLGTTRKKTPDEAAYEAIDLHGVMALAQAAQQAGATHFLTVSSVGADSGSRSFYLRTKGRMEDGVRALGFARLDIFRPGLLRGPRGEFRLGEKLVQAAQRLIDPLLIGSLARYRSIQAGDVARAVVACAMTPGTGVFVHHNREMQTAG